MIESIDITSLGVIEKARVEFGPGLTVLTGETGAGKTMVLTSLHLLLGGRADSALVRNDAERADVDGVFSIPEVTERHAQEAGVVVEDGVLIAGRTISAQGRSRAYLGSRPVPASLLDNLLSPMVTIHGQSDQIRLKNPTAQLDALDEFGGPHHEQLIGEYKRAWGQAVRLKRLLDEVSSDHEQRHEEIEELTQAIGDIDALDTYEGEEVELAAESRRLTNVQDLRRYLSSAVGSLHNDEAADALMSLRNALGEIRSATRFDTALDEYAQRLESFILDVEGLRDDIESYVSRLEDDPLKLSAIHDRRARLRRAMEGRAADTGELLVWVESARQRLSELTRPGTDPHSIAQELTAAQSEVLKIGRKLSAQRRQLTEKLAQAVDVELHALSMPNAKLIIELKETKPTSHGLEDVVFLLQPHPSASPRPLGQGASGGELSRVMLALEVVLGEGASATTFLFDEVDSGIGGRTATEVGARLARLSRNRQVIVVTHLAQVAAFASTHLVVSKTDGVTDVRRVSGQEREAELTRMMGGDPHSEAARRHAIEVLGSAVSQS